MKKFTKFTIGATLLLASISGEAQQATITINTIADPGFEMSSIVLAPRTTNMHIDMVNPWGSQVFTVLPGTYDLLGEYNYANGRYYILKDNITITNDTTITIDVSEAKLFDTKFYSPEGVELKTDKYGFVEGNYVRIEEGNIGSCTGHGVFYRKADGLRLSDLSIDATPQIYMNDFGKDFIYVDSRMYYNNDANGDVYISKFYKDGDGTSCLQNNIGDYVCYEGEILPSIAGKDGEKSKGVSLDLIYNGNLIANSVVNLQGNHAKIWSCSPIEPENKDSRFDVLFKPVFGEQQEVTYSYPDGEGGTIEYKDNVLCQSYGPSVAIKDGKEHFICNNYFINTPNDFLRNPNNSYLQSIYPGASVFSYTQDEMLGQFGDNVPINIVVESATVNFMNPSELLPVFNCNFVGRYGENRRGDIQSLQMTMKVNGQPIDCDYSGLSNYYAPWTFDRVIGETELTFDSQNVLVDNIKGHNRTNVYFDESKDDHYAPTLTMLQMRDNNGNLTDRFTTAQDGKVMFSCGDFNCNKASMLVKTPVSEIEYSTFYFKCESPVVEVSVAPNGQEDWLALTTTEDTEAFTPYGFGHVFDANISSLDTDGWYDLKFKLTDAAGNYQEQIISPAFRIGDAQTGIGNVKVGNTTEVARYTVDGRAISTPQAGVNIVKMSDGSVKKVWVK
ncbi:MAG: hypothetical protein KBT10_02720 [Bacteroidales bacterium]|nr:hypothetical protein [Candidatus Sodaliphilus aphodohippi]